MFEEETALMSLAALSHTPSYPDTIAPEGIAGEHTDADGLMGSYLLFADECNALYSRLFMNAESMPDAKDALTGALRYLRSDATTPRGDSRVASHYWAGILKGLNSDGLRLQSTFGMVFAKLTPIVSTKRP